MKQLKLPNRVNILGVGISAVNMAQTLNYVEQAVDSGIKGYVCVQGVHGIMEAQSDPKLRKVFNESLLTVPDGMPTVWFGKTQGHEDMGRVFGPDLMIEVLRLSLKKGYRHYLLGGNTGVAAELKTALEVKVPGVKIVGTFTPPFRPLNSDEETALIREVGTLKPDIIWVGISTPKQDRFMAQYVDRLDTKLMFGVGAAFDYHTGKIKDAPDWVKDSGLQWLHRLAQEPGRLWKRYLINNPKFIVAAGLQLAGLRHYSLNSESNPSLR